MRRLLRYSIALILATAVSIAGIQAVQAASGEENGFTSRINAERSQRGLRSLSWSEELAGVARRHAQRMANEDHLYHNPNLRNEVDNWEVLGENVGYGPGVDDLHQAFMNSSSHRANILDPVYTQVGVGTVWRDGTLWVTQVFRKPMSASNSGSNSGSGSSGSGASLKKAAKPKVSKPKAAPKPAPAPAPPAPKAAPAAPFAELTRHMIESLLGGQEPASSSVQAADFALSQAALGSASVVGLTFRPFAELAGRVNRELLESAAGR